MKHLKGKEKFILIVIFLMTALILSACAPAAPAATDETEVEETEAEPDETEAAVEETDEPEAEETDEASEETEEAPVEVSDIPSVLSMPDEIAGGRPVEISVTEMPPESLPELQAGWLDQAQRFMDMYPNVTIVGDTYHYDPTSFEALVAANQVPTLFEVYLTDPSKMIDRGIAADITAYIEEQNLGDVFNPRVLAIGQDDNGHYYGIPKQAYVMGLAYNIEMLEAAGYDAPPSSWEEALEMSAALTDRDAGVAGLSFITDGSAAAGWHLTTLGYTFGLEQADIVNQTDDGFQANFDNEAMLDTINLIHDLRWTSDVLPRENLDWPRNGEALATERAAMVVMAGDQLAWIRTTFADAPIEKFGFAPLPSGPNGESASLIGGNIAMVNAQATDDQVEAAVYFRLWVQMDAAEVQNTIEASAKDPTVVIGAPVLPLYVGEYQAARKALDVKYANLPIENYQLFTEAVEGGNVRLVPEPLVAGQEYYGIVGALVSQIVTDEGIDLQAALEEAINTYQTNVLDQIEAQ